MALNSLDIERSCINYFRPGINSIAFFHEDVKLLHPMALLGHGKVQCQNFHFFASVSSDLRQKLTVLSI